MQVFNSYLLSVAPAIGVVTIPLFFSNEYTEEPLTEDSVWVTKTSSSRENVFTNIRSGKRTYGRVAIIGRKGQEVYSEILSRVVQ